MSGKTQDNFEKGIFWELYQDLERQFLNFLEYVPYLDGNENVYSFKLMNLILSIGGYVDSAFKEMVRYPKFSNNVQCQEILRKLKTSEERKEKGRGPIPVPIKLPLSVFEEIYKLSKRVVIFKRLPGREGIVSFRPHNPKTKAPEWWEIYNGLKHDVSINIRKSNLQTTLHALAGAFSLNAIHIPSVLRFYKYGFVKIESLPTIMGGFNGVPPFLVPAFSPTLKEVQKKYEKDYKLATQLETPLFIYDYNQ